jgi:hypothetical protein
LGKNPWQTPGTFQDGDQEFNNGAKLLWKSVNRDDRPGSEFRKSRANGRWEKSCACDDANVYLGAHLSPRPLFLGLNNRWGGSRMKCRFLNFVKLNSYTLASHLIGFSGQRFKHG